MRRVTHIMLFASFLGCIESVARLGDNATAGNVQKMNSHLTIGQVKRLLRQLGEEGYVESEYVAYGRTGKYVYRLSQRCDVNMNIVTGAINQVFVEEGAVS